MKFKYSLLCGVTAIGLCTQAAQAAVVHVSGDTVDFYYNTDDIDPLFGTIYVSGDTIFATPSAFSANDTTSDFTSVVTSALGTIRVETKDGYSFSSVAVSEGGEYNISNSASSVEVDASLRLFDWSAPLPGFGTEENLTMAVSPLDQKDGFNHSWSASGSFDMTTATWDGIHNVGLSLTNILTASAVDGGTAFVNKNIVGAIGFTFETVAPVPVPAAVWLFGSGLLGLVGIARRTKK